jgi:DeoR family transcriptional regulator of aga operon
MIAQHVLNRQQNAKKVDKTQSLGYDDVMDTPQDQKETTQNPSQLLSSERQALILELLDKTGVVRTTDLREVLKVSPGTIRADLRELETQGVLEIVHGGAVATRSANDSKLRIDERARQNTDKKRRIGATASQLVINGQTLIVDSGSTTAEFINALTQTIDYLQIVTHGLNIATIASRLANVEVLMPGGIVRSSTQTLVGPQVVSFFEMINAQVVFLATNGFSIEHGVTTANMLEAEIKRKIIQRADKIVLLADSSKYGKRQALRVMPIQELDVLITDRDLDEGIAQELAKLNIEVLRV